MSNRTSDASLSSLPRSMRRLSVDLAVRRKSVDLSRIDESGSEDGSKEADIESQIITTL